MAMEFTKATKKQAKLRMALVGPAGSGKTYTALSLACKLGAKVAVIDTERGSASKYADVFDFDRVELDTFSPATYIEALTLAEKHGFDVVVIDSYSHAWSGEGGALDQADKAAKKSQSGNTYTAWRDVTPEHNRLVDKILSYKGHIIVTMRAKTEYVMEPGKNGKMSPRKIGMAPIMRQGTEYEFDVVGDMTLDHDMIVSKTRCSALAGEVYHKPGAELAGMLLEWLGRGEEAKVEAKVELKTPKDDGARFYDAIASALSLQELTTVGAYIRAQVTDPALKLALGAEFTTKKKALSEVAPKSDVNGDV